MGVAMFHLDQESRLESATVQKEPRNSVLIVLHRCHPVLAHTHAAPAAFIIQKRISPAVWLAVAVAVVAAAGPLLLLETASALLRPDRPTKPKPLAASPRVLRAFAKWSVWQCTIAPRDYAQCHETEKGRRKGKKSSEAAAAL